MALYHNDYFEKEKRTMSLFGAGKKKEVKYASLYKLTYIKKSEINTADTWSESEWQK